MTFVQWKEKEGEVMAFLFKVEENYSEVSVSQPYVPTKCICRLWQCIKGEGALCPAENSNTRARRPCLGDVGPGQALSGQHHLSHWYLKWHQQILCKWQPEIYNCTLRESLYTKKKGKTKRNVQCFPDFDWWNYNIRGPFGNSCC